MSVAPLRVEPIDRHGLRRFIAAAAPLYADDPNWVHPLFLERLEHLDPARNPSLRRMEVGYWLALRGDRPVGRISAQVNQAHLERYDDATGQFGFLEAVDDPEVFGALTGTAEDWLRARGMRRVTGPFSLSINEESGLLVEGFDTPPAIMMGHHRPFYAGRLVGVGYRAIRTLVAYEFDVAADWPPAARRMMQWVERLPSVRIRPIDMRRYAAELETMRQIFNDAWADNWGFLPWTAEEVQALGRNIRPLVTAGNFAIGEVAGEPAAMVVTLPNVNEAISDLGGRLLPTGALKLLWRLKIRGLRTARMPLMGVLRKHQGTPRGAALALGVIAAARDHARSRGVRRAELSWILEDNRPVREIIDLVGARPYKRYCIFEKVIG